MYMYSQPLSLSLLCSIYLQPDTSSDNPDPPTTASSTGSERPTLVDRLYTVPAGGRAGGDEGVGEGEREAHKRLQREYMKYRRTAKVGAHLYHTTLSVILSCVCAQVVYIVEKVQSRACAGCLKAFDKVSSPHVHTCTCMYIHVHVDLH